MENLSIKYGVKEAFNAVIREYYCILIGSRDQFEKVLFEELSVRDRELVAVNVIRFTSETFWGWSPEHLRDHLTVRRLADWKLRTMLDYISFPEGMSKTRDSDLYYISCLAYPNLNLTSTEDFILTIYKKILDGTSEKFPKHFFDGFNGPYRASVCLQYAISHFRPFKSKSEMYDFFGTRKCLSFMRKVKLLPSAKNTYDCLAEMLHNGLGYSDKSEYLFLYYRLFQILEESERVERETRGRKEKEKGRG